MSKESYREYLKSEHWKGLKKDKLSKTLKRCAICMDKENVELHHLAYKKLHDVDTKDLRWLCRQCHQVAHELLNSGVLKYKSTSHHSRFASTKYYVRRARGINSKTVREKHFRG